jgi:hypothetical protein
MRTITVTRAPRLTRTRLEDLGIGGDVRDAGGIDELDFILDGEKRAAFAVFSQAEKCLKQIAEAQQLLNGGALVMGYGGDEIIFATHDPERARALDMVEETEGEIDVEGYFDLLEEKRGKAA